MKLTLEDIRTALYDMNIPAVRNMSKDEDLAAADFWYDLHMDEHKVMYLMSNLERQHRILLPVSVTDSLKMKNSVGTLLGAANHQLVERI